MGWDYRENAKPGEKSKTAALSWRASLKTSAGTQLSFVRSAPNSTWQTFQYLSIKSKRIQGEGQL